MRSNHKTTTVNRHSLVVRICHWVNAISFVFLLITGIHIFMGLPELYWGNVGYLGYPSIFRYTDFGLIWDGRWGRNYHFLFVWIFTCNGFFYLIWGIRHKHFYSNMFPDIKERTRKQVGMVLRENMTVWRLQRNNTIKYNVVQKIFYVIVIFLLVPLMFLTGFAQMPACNAIAPWMIDILGGRQSARTIHVIISLLLVGFLFVHLVQVIRHGLFSELLAMTIGNVNKDKETNEGQVQ